MDCLFYNHVFKFQNACLRRPCPSNATCQAGFGKTGYRCVCPPEYHGEKCELGKEEWNMGERRCIWNFSSRVQFYISLNRCAHPWNIYKQPCIIMFIINVLMATFLTVFRRSPNTFWKFPKILRSLSKRPTIVAEHARKTRKVTANFRR